MRTTCSAVAFIGVRQRALDGANKGAVVALTLPLPTTGTILRVDGAMTRLRL